ncbi:MAG TPA: DNA-formamidopyrimidine glycosylase family protein [Acidimicrobiales bacterium]|nr:DNA-formamidopyrimidine glycosylase family protein [Acidimicrobiales bacterium]
MPELPEMQALSERLDALLAGTTLARVDVLGFSSLKTYAPAPDSVLHHRLVSVSRRAKYLVWHFDDGIRFVLHLSQAGRLDVEQPPKLTRPRGSAVRFVFARGDAGVEGPSVAVLVREYGTHRKVSWWVLPPDEDGPLDGLGPEPGSEEFAELIRTSQSKRRLTTDLRDQRVLSGIGRGWGDDIMHRAHLSPFTSFSSLSREQREFLLSAATSVLDEALALERTREGGLSEAKLGGRFKVHGRAEEPCPSQCGDTLQRVSFESYEMTYCPTCQTGGRHLKDRRLSRLLK